MFLLVRRCAEHMTQLHRLKVTGQGQMIYPALYLLIPLRERERERERERDAEYKTSRSA